MVKQITTTQDPEITAISEVYAALKDLDNDARARVLNYVSSKLNVSNVASQNNFREEYPEARPEASYDAVAPVSEDLEGISPAGRKWITRNGIKPSKLMSIFSLGIDEIDLVSKSVPGDKKSQRMRNVFLLKGLAAYLGTGVARFTHEQAKEACLHYDAWDGSNFAANFKSLVAEVSGTKDSGYTLTAKGISEATSLVKATVGVDS